ncbi:MAG: OmpA family protein [Bacteroidota bacterium]
MAFALFARWFYVCQVKGLCAEQTRPLTMQLLDENGQAVINGYEQFFFDTMLVSPDMTDNNQLFLDSVAAYLENRADRNLTITGLYRPSESKKSSGIFENLGVARADRIRSMLVRRGIEEERITLDYEQSSDESLTIPLFFDLFIPETPEEFERTAFTFENMTFSDANFDYKSADFNPGEQLISYADSVKTFLELYPDRSLTIIGHTDSIGSDVYNDTLGMKRAKNALIYFRNLGVTAAIETETQGKRRPVAPNSKPNGADNPEGRQKNRRVNFVIE